MGPGSEFDAVRLMQGVWGDRAVGIGDDTAQLTIPAGETLVTSTDIAVERVHFRREWISLAEIAFRAVTAALSDLAAAAAAPHGILVALSLPDATREGIEELALGIGDAAATAETRIIGGDLSRADCLSLAVTVIGSAASPLSRRGARPGDLLYVTGVLGGPAMAVNAWHAGEAPSPWARRRFTSPRARLREARWLAANGASAAIDISDGLASELRHLAAASNVELRVDVGRIPVGDGGSWETGCASGEEYELLVACRTHVDADAFVRRFGVPLTRIGTVRASDAPNVVAMSGERRVDLPAGHDHFSR